MLPKKSLLPHQEQALNATIEGFANSSRGKLIMACGTGKTFTALKIAEAVAGKNKQVLFVFQMQDLFLRNLMPANQQEPLLPSVPFLKQLQNN